MNNAVYSRVDNYNQICNAVSSIKIQPSALVPLGYGKYVRSDQVTAVEPAEEERGSGKRMFVRLLGGDDVLIASRAGDSIVLDPAQEPREIAQSPRQQEILRDLPTDLSRVSATVRRIARDAGNFDFDRFERRIREVVQD